MDAIITISLRIIYTQEVGIVRSDRKFLNLIKACHRSPYPPVEYKLIRFPIICGSIVVAAKHHIIIKFKRNFFFNFKFKNDQ